MIRDCLRDLSTLAHLQHLEIPKLQQYHLPRSPAQGSMPDSEGLYAVQQAPRFPSLQHLDVSGWDCVCPESLWALLAAGPHLRTVAARGCDSILPVFIQGLEGIGPLEHQLPEDAWPRNTKPAGLRVLGAAAVNKLRQEARNGGEWFRSVSDRGLGDEVRIIAWNV